jgi:hypothetical protein
MDFICSGIGVAGRDLGGAEMKIYPVLRTTHLLCGVCALPFLVMYALSAVQMAHSRWFNMKSAITESEAVVPAGMTDGRVVAREVMRTGNVRGEITEVKDTPAGFEIQVHRPGTEHEIRYDRADGSARVRTKIAGFWGMINRLHHAAGLWHEYGPTRWWAVLCALTSVAAIGLGATGIWMWWLRKQERRWGLVLLAANVVFAIAVLGAMRAAGP